MVVAEDVWGEPFEAMADEVEAVHDSALWADRERLLAVLSGAQALVVRNRTRVDRRLLGAAPGLEVVARAGRRAPHAPMVGARAS
ncbi:MAG: hypothetical protein ACRDN9_08025, partial [Streptosporangiaceae bacterium]